MHFNLSTVLILATAILSVNASPSPAESLSIVEHSLPASVACAASGAVAPEAEEDHGVETDGEEETWEEVVDQEREKRENKMKQNGVKRDGSQYQTFLLQCPNPVIRDQSDQTNTCIINNGNLLQTFF
ncbi:hypothetical protein MBM_07491 [Drepanopeziza brunnea f. sp. 'multigermtubi' MB_m1]|uniref:Uncharacterized protein n=1 Tax=Marssonina brunnea f. sp. multigermtubi (strain MB_m1) TaxID=1072389 RepID=K1WN13_MARBU|nr:uncharacterized protein MBM_07491 [Drepanopeziza brunnea f. sp. 'multigermtubi' MB_m1]EKD14261.1 hypothetical protein MBM_07491 [Drepanopeziza brunnea f. sp. 'multigermtubi' MB_m1]